MQPVAGTLLSVNGLLHGADDLHLPGRKYISCVTAHRGCLPPNACRAIRKRRSDVTSVTDALSPLFGRLAYTNPLSG